MADVSSANTSTSATTSSNALVRRTKSARRSERRRISEEGLGVWTRVEHARFLEGKRLFPDGPWKLVAEYVGTRNTRQTMTHAQKYRQKLERRQRGLRTTRKVSDDDLLLAPELYYTSSPRTPHAPVSTAADAAHKLDVATGAPLAGSSVVAAAATTKRGTFEQLLMGDTICLDLDNAARFAPSAERCSPTHHADIELPWLDECLDYLILNLL